MTQFDRTLCILGLVIVVCLRVVAANTSLNGTAPAVNSMDLAVNSMDPAVNGMGTTEIGMGSTVNGMGTTENGMGTTEDGMGTTENDMGTTVNGIDTTGNVVGSNGTTELYCYEHKCTSDANCVGFMLNLTNSDICTDVKCYWRMQGDDNNLQDVGCGCPDKGGDERIMCCSNASFCNNASLVGITNSGIPTDGTPIIDDTSMETKTADYETTEYTTVQFDTASNSRNETARLDAANTTPGGVTLQPDTATVARVDSRITIQCYEFVCLNDTTCMQNVTCQGEQCYWRRFAYNLQDFGCGCPVEEPGATVTCCQTHMCNDANTSVTHEMNTTFSRPQKNDTFICCGTKDLKSDSRSIMVFTTLLFVLLGRTLSTSY